MSARDRVLGRVRAALLSKPAADHPGDFGGWRPEGSSTDPGAVDLLRERLEAAGAEFVRLADAAAVGAWLADFARDFASMTVGRGVPAALRPDLPETDAAEADLGISVARGAIAETGSLMMDARDGRRSQLLAPTHVVLVRAEDVHATFRDALLTVRGDLPSAIGLHSGPSKSADIAQTMVKGVHGPGRLVAVVHGGGGDA